MTWSEGSLAAMRLAPDRAGPPETHASFAPAIVAETTTERTVIRLTGALILCSIVLQRIALPIGSSFTSLVGPLGFAIAGIGLAQGVFCLDRRRTLLYLAFATLVLLGAAADSLMPPPFGVPMSWPSGLQLLLLNSFAMLGFTEPVDEERFFRAVNGCFLFVALAGLLQFAAQFAGVSIFRFSDAIPAQFLTEQLTGGGYNNQIPITLGSPWFKSNGFFLAEPSIFSQFMAVALAIEILLFRRPIFIAVFLTAMLTSLSGTGWIVFAIFLATVGLSLGMRGLLIALASVVGIVVVLGLWSVAMPESFAGFIERAGETSSVGSSGNIRFIGPFWIAGHVIERAPWALFFGIGFGLSERLSLPYEADINTPIKIALENGVPALACYLCLISVGQQTARQIRLAPAILTLLILTGGYAQFPPVLFPMLLILSIATLKPSRMTA